MVRHSLKFVSWKDRKAVAADLKEIYRSVTVEVAEKALDSFAAKWDDKYPAISPSLKNNWANIIPLFAYPKDIRRAIYTTNAIESLNMSLKKIIKSKASFPNDDALKKILYLALNNIEKKWTMPVQNWSGAINQFLILFGDRLPLTAN